jgi:hypothetical protein
MFTRLTWLLSPTFWLFIFKTINRNVVSSGESAEKKGFVRQNSSVRTAQRKAVVLLRVGTYGPSDWRHFHL